ncbi:hypothetical protein ACFV0T_10155 [Streptomyces sp. NPDC059582]|uniref:hypothetical protein n=1 Tax=Streptomyces sp. NPDC059582 TaxID=3346875 RepID=UPI0036B468C4
MKIRRALAGAAATAVLAPLALLSAPVAFADGTPGTSTATPAPGASSPAAGDPAPAPGPSGGADEGDGPGQSPGAGTPNGITSSTPSESGSPAEGPAGQPTECPSPTGGVDPESRLDTSVSGLPDKIAAGSGWHGFTLTLSNKGEKSLGTVRWGTFFSDTGMSDPGRDRLEYHITIQHFDPRTHSWEGLPDTAQGNGYLYGTTEIGPKGTAVLKLRAEIDSDVDFSINGYDVDRINAQADSGGRYTDGETTCEHFTKSLDLFTVLKPGSGGGDDGNGDDPGEATQDPTGEPAGGDHPQGGPGETPATGDLASTGAGSALPVIALAGGVAVVAGAGTVFTVRRRRGGSHA